MGASDEPLYGEPTEADRVSLAELILQLRANGIRDRRVLSAIEAIPRRLFLGFRHQDLAYADRALPIECGQTISQPTIVAMMTEALDVQPDHRVLEIGTGSGYQAAVLAKLAREVYTVERYRSLLEMAQDRFKALKLENIKTQVGDGFDGWAEAAPFHRIIVTAASEDVPETLASQLVDHGLMIIPIGTPGGVQDLVKVTKIGSRREQTSICAVRFVPMVHGVAERL
ncbi:protein-L-isoaspartate(D-aspartate) O-methyltransferase [Amorphus orientalis]|uniref:Protein-L-isoaspartate O-methyltransferase n=1 Tax=Amorphus orientalis TaxID=649198 RepID=A0AAE4ATF5_9HYPH|nr:protein-L-isoaspartate(D-aspartate) O-methyltransferase [Amorphus orientalis]MDQ0316228.1 protein-L-isoaspartate(D-aspartate) O-methyltransferase [Amorphus orientalis]